MSHGREKWKSGGRSAQISEDSDPDWMYHKPAPDKWEQFLDKVEKKSMKVCGRRAFKNPVV